MLDQIQGLFNEEFAKDVGNLHAAASSYVRSVSEGFTFPCPPSDVIWRSALRKSYETLGTVLRMVEERRAGMALPLLRPTCEDLLYVLYFSQIAATTTNRIIVLGANREILESMIAQSGER